MLWWEYVSDVIELDLHISEDVLQFHDLRIQASIFGNLFLDTAVQILDSSFAGLQMVLMQLLSTD